MNRSLLKHELKIMFKSKKNSLFILFLGALLFSYCLFILPNAETTDSFDIQKLRLELEELSIEQREREKSGFTGINMMAGPVYAANEYYYQIHRKMIVAYESEDFRRFLHLRTHYIEENEGSFPEDETLFSKSPFPGKDKTHLYQQTLLRYQGYLAQDLLISNSIIEQKTALQTVQKLFLSPVILLLLFCAIYFSSDILVRDRQNRTILQGLPFTWYRILNMKTVASFLYTLVVLLVFMVVGITIISIQAGFGFFDMQIPIRIIQENFSLSDFDLYEMIPLALFLVKTISVIPILIYLFIRMNVLFSLLFKNEWIVLMISTIVLFSERLYSSRTLRELFGYEISYFPQTYFEFGRVVSGDKNFLVNLQTITYVKGFIVLIVTIVIIELVLFVVSCIVNKRRFYQ